VSILAAPRDDERRYDTVLTAFVAVALVALLLVGGRRLLGPKASPRTRAARRRSRRHP
jgi:hypothetical protein